MTPAQLSKAASRISELQRLERIAERIGKIMDSQDDDDTRINIVFSRSSGMNHLDADVLTDEQREAIVEYVRLELGERLRAIKAEIKGATAASLVK